MSKITGYHTLAFECDDCGEIIEAEEGENFHDLVSRAKRESWRTTTTTKSARGEWVHICPDCNDPEKDFD